MLLRFIPIFQKLLFSVKFSFKRLLDQINYKMPSVEQVESVVCEAVTEMPAEKKAKIENGKSADFSSEVISDVTSDVTSDSTSDVTRDVTSEKPGKNGVTSMDVGSNATAESSDASTDSSDVPESLAVSAEPLSATSDKIIRQVLRFAKLSEHAKAPTRGSVDAAGYDLYAAEEKVIEPGKRACVKVRKVTRPRIYCDTIWDLFS